MASVRTAGFPRAVTIYGVGLIGGSLALALKKAYPGIRIHGVDTPRTLARAKALGIIDDGPAALPDLIVLATPVGAILDLIDGIKPGSALVFDVGSTKMEICRRAEARKLRFIGGHPMAGKEIAGPEAADAELFRERPFFLCKISSTPRGALKRMAKLLRDIHAVPIQKTPKEHDRGVAELSHLPQLLSAVLMDQTAARSEYAGPGWETWARLAGSPFHVWSDIFETSDFLPEALETFIERLRKAQRALESGELDSIEAIFKRANLVKAGRRSRPGAVS